MNIIVKSELKKTLKFFSFILRKILPYSVRVADTRAMLAYLSSHRLLDRRPSSENSKFSQKVQKLLLISNFERLMNNT